MYVVSICMKIKKLLFSFSFFNSLRSSVKLAILLLISFLILMAIVVFYLVPDALIIFFP